MRRTVGATYLKDLIAACSIEATPNPDIVTACNSQIAFVTSVVDTDASWRL